MITCIITGSNSGIGKAAARQLAGKGYRVVLACRNMVSAAEACDEIRQAADNRDVHAMRVDLSRMDDVRRFAGEYARQFDTLDVLINNAADFDISRKVPEKTPEGNEAQFATNFMGPVVLINELLPMLKKSEDARIINIASQGLTVYPNIRLDFGNFRAEKSYSPAKAYYQSKLALLTYSHALREQLQGSGVSVHAVRVTNVKVDMDRYRNIPKAMQAMYRIKSKFSISPDEMAAVYIALAAGEKRDGFYYDEKLREVTANRAVYDAKASGALWTLAQGY